MTEASPVVNTSSEHDLFPGSSGSLLPGFKARIIDAEGNEVTEHDKRGELIVQSPSIVLGYLNNEKANAETFIHLADGRWLKTGDEALVRKSPNGHEHIFITDRIKELIKVKVSGQKQLPLGLTSSLIQTHHLTKYPGLPSRTGRAGGPPPLPPVRVRLHRHPCPRRPRRRGAQGLRRALRRRSQGQVRRRGHSCHREACGGSQDAVQVAQGWRRVYRRDPQESEWQDPEETAQGQGKEGKRRKGFQAVALVTYLIFLKTHERNSMITQCKMKQNCAKPD